MYRVTLPINYDGFRYGIKFFKGVGVCNNEGVAKRLKDKGFVVEAMKVTPPEEEAREENGDGPAAKAEIITPTEVRSETDSEINAGSEIVLEPSAASDTEAVKVDDATPGGEAELYTMNTTQLKSYAAEHCIDISEAKNSKASILGEILKNMETEATE